jgi:hypothetical protein
VFPNQDSGWSQHGVALQRIVMSNSPFFKYRIFLYPILSCVELSDRYFDLMQLLNKLEKNASFKNMEYDIKKLHGVAAKPSEVIEKLRFYN